MKIYALSLLLVLFNPGAATHANPSQPPQAQKPTLSVSIAVAEAAGQRIIRLTAADPHFDVVICNVSKQPQLFYSEQCSMGYDNLRLELISIDGKILPQPITVERSVLFWLGNFIFTTALKPGATMVREVRFDNGTDFSGVPYRNFPPMNAGEIHMIRMRAVFEVQSKGTHSEVWIGRIVSDIQDYRVEK